MSTTGLNQRPAFDAHRRTWLKPVVHQMQSVADAVSHSGGSANDITLGGVYTGPGQAQLRIVIAAEGAPDTFDWTLIEVGGEGRTLASGTGENVVSAAVGLAYGITVLWAGTDNHTAGEEWVRGYMSGAEVFEQSADDGSLVQEMRGRMALSGALETLLGDSALASRAESLSAYRFDGTGDSVEVADAADIDVDLDDFALRVVFRPEELGATIEYLVNKEGGGIGYGLYLDERSLFIRCDDNTTDSSGVIVEGCFVRGCLYDVVVNFDRSGNATAWINGERRGTRSISGSALTLANAGVMEIGAAVGGGTPFAGEIHQVTLFNRLLTVAEIDGLASGMGPGYQLADCDVTEHLAETNFATHANWDVTNDFDDTGGNADLTWSANQTSTLTQTTANRAVAGVGRKRYRFAYTVTVTTAFDGTLALTITNAFARAAVVLPFTAGRQVVEFESAAVPGDFVISAVTTGCTEGQISIDDVELIEIGEVLNLGGIKQSARWIDDCQGANDAGTFNGNVTVVNRSPIPDQLMSTAANRGAALIGYQDVNSSIASVAGVAGAIDELATPLTLTVDAEGPDVGDVINVTVTGPAHVAQYMAQVYDEDSILGLAAAWTLTEVGAGAPVFGDGTPTLLFTTSAAGAATIRVTDVATGTNETVLLVVTPMGASAGAKPGPAAAVTCNFDA